MKVSIIIPNYNQGHLIEKAIQSAHSQKHNDDFEVIVVDDASTDDSVQKIEKFIKEHGKVSSQFIKRETNGGLPAARNSGLKVAKYDTIAFLDSDDIYYPEKITKSTKVLERFANVGVVYTDYDVLDMQNGGTTKREFKNAFDLRLFQQQCIISTNSVVRKDIFDKVGLYNEKYRTTEDYELWFRVLKHFFAYHIPESLFCYRLHGENLTIKYRDTIIQQSEELKRKGFQ